MKYLLDTNTCIRHLNQRSKTITEHLHSLSDSEIAVCSVVKAELYFGAMKSQTPEQTMLKQQAFVERFISLSFDDAAAVVYARFRAILEQAGTPIGSNDLMIAAIALAHSLILVTHNTREFGRISGLKVEDWEAGHAG
ncbi:MAG: type II toxin-antitoxin system VapC family toxin [Chloroflexi bacterium]|nr:type II toxin-antitoxin system VapC family toxin [Chloroflexota bacterium]